MNAPSNTTDRRMPVVGFIGGIGSGKSSLARWLADRRRAVVIDADAIGHEVLTQPDIQQRLRERFGPEVLSDGHVDRSWLAARVFGDSDEHRRNRADLEAIVHPPMRDAFVTAIQQARESGDVEMMLIDAAILLETGWGDICDAVVFLDAPFEQRLRRVAVRNWSAEDLRRRGASQWPLDQKRAAADVVIDNSGTIEAAGRHLEQFLTQRFHSQPDIAALVP